MNFQSITTIWGDNVGEWQHDTQLTCFGFDSHFHSVVSCGKDATEEWQAFCNYMQTAPYALSERWLQFYQYIPESLLDELRVMFEHVVTPPPTADVEPSEGEADSAGDNK